MNDIYFLEKSEARGFAVQDPEFVVKIESADTAARAFQGVIQVTPGTLTISPTRLQEHWTGFRPWHHQAIASTEGLLVEWPATPHLSQKFIRRLFTFVSWLSDWDEEGADRIGVEVAAKAHSLAEEALAYAAEPHIAPARDGSLLLLWEFSDGSSVEYYVEGSENTGVAVLVSGLGVQEVELSSRWDLFRLLAQRRN